MAVKVCIVGCGSLGNVFAAHLALAESVEVYVYDASPDCVRALNDRGVVVTGAANLTAPVTATTRAADIPPCDYGIFATKSLHTAAAVEQTAPIFGNTSAVCSIQNGLGNEELIATRVKNVVRGVTSMAAHVTAPGHSVLEFYGHLWIGPFEPAGTPLTVVERLASLLAEAGLPCDALPDARGAQWTKLIFNSAVNAVGGLTGLHHGAAYRLPPTGDLLEAVLCEGEAVAEALDITLTGNPRAILVEGANSPVKRYPSMVQDVFGHRQTEVDFLNGAIADVGEKFGVPVPVNRTLWRLMKGLEHSWTDPA